MADEEGKTSDEMLLKYYYGTISHFRSKTKKLLVEEYKYTKKKADEIENKIHASVMSSLRHLYQKKNIIRPGETFIDQEYSIVKDWIDLLYNIPFYQSLGDTLGYYNGKWEFNYGNAHAGPDYVNEMIYEFIDMGGVNGFDVKNWKSSDDTIMYATTLNAVYKLYKISETPEYVGAAIDPNLFGQILQKFYIEIMPKMKDRHPGSTTMISLEVQKNIEWDKLAYNSNANGAGAAMRSGCIGFFYCGQENRHVLLEMATECARITHNSATGILSSITSALFTAFALEKVPVSHWVNKLLELINDGYIDYYIKKTRPDDYESFDRDQVIYIDQWKKYSNLFFVGGTTPSLDDRVMKNLVQRYGILIENFSKGCQIPGSCGDDCLIMAYDSLLRCGGNFEKLIMLSILHPGDSDTVGSIAFSWYGAVYGMKHTNKIKKRFQELEFYNYLVNLGEKCSEYYALIFGSYIYYNFAMEYIKENVRPAK